MRVFIVPHYARQEVFPSQDLCTCWPLGLGRFPTRLCKILHFCSSVISLAKPSFPGHSVSISFYLCILFHFSWADFLSPSLEYKCNEALFFFIAGLGMFVCTCVWMCIHVWRCAADTCPRDSPSTQEFWVGTKPLPSKRKDELVRIIRDDIHRREIHSNAHDDTDPSQ